METHLLGRKVVRLAAIVTRRRLCLAGVAHVSELRPAPLIECDRVDVEIAIDDATHDRDLVVKHVESMGEARGEELDLRLRQACVAIASSKQHEQEGGPWGGVWTWGGRGMDVGRGKGGTGHDVVHLQSLVSSRCNPRGGRRGARRRLSRCMSRPPWSSVALVPGYYCQ